MIRGGIFSLCLVMGASFSYAQPTSIATMRGVCQPNSQLSRFTASQWKSKSGTPSGFQCNSAVLTELANGRVIIHFSDAGKANSTTVGFAGSFENEMKTHYRVDGLYLIGAGYDDSRMDSRGQCDVEYKNSKIVSIGCLSATKAADGGAVVASAIFKVSEYSVSLKSASAPSQAARPQREPWYGVAEGGRKCVPTDMSPAERIEWLRDQGIKYDAIDYAGPEVNGRVPKVTIIPKGVRMPNWVYYATKSFCEEKETSIDKYR